jgi:hypothetical protein
MIKTKEVGFNSELVYLPLLFSIWKKTGITDEESTFDIYIFILGHRWICPGF